MRANPGVTRAATVELYSQAHGLLNIHRWMEPLGLVPLEAMACGAVPIATKEGGPTETIIHGTTGFLVSDDYEAEELIKRDAVREINPEVMRRHVEENFSLPKFIERWEFLLQRVLAGDRW